MENISHCCYQLACSVYALLFCQPNVYNFPPNRSASHCLTLFEHRLNLFEETQSPEESDGAVYPAALQLVAETAVDSYWETDMDAAQSQTAVAVDSYLATVVDTDQSQTAVAVDTYLATVVDTAQSQTAVNDNSETAAAVDTHNDILEVGNIAAEAAAAAAGLQNPGTALSGSGDSAADCLRVDPGSSHRIPHPV